MPNPTGESKWMGYALSLPGADVLHRLISLKATAALAGATLLIGVVACLGAETGDQSQSRVAQKGLHIDFDKRPASAPALDANGTVFQEFEVTFRITDAATQQPLTGRRPGAWIDATSSAHREQTGSCKEKVASFLRSSTGARPIVDLTSYYILAFNHDASISVIDPLVGMPGQTNLLATIALAGPPADWTKSPDQKRLYVSIPSAGKIAVIDAESFKLLEEIDAGRRPVRLILSADARYLFVANDAEDDEKGGLTVIDTSKLRTIAHLATGRGHHEIALSQSGEFLFISHREKSDIAVIDTETFRLIERIQIGQTPIAMAYSVLAQALYVVDGTAGTVTVIDGRTPHVIARIDLRPGLGPIALTPDGRWALVLNTRDNVVHVIEVATNRIIQEIAIGARPYQIMMSDAFAYVVSLDSERVGMISLKDLGKKAAEQSSSFPAGVAPPVSTPDLGIGALVARAVDDAAVLVANPAENMINYYIEGNLAPSGSFRNPDKEVRMIGIVDHGLKETDPGVYTARARLPAGGSYEAAIMVGAVFECFPLSVPNGSASTLERTRISYLDAPATSTTNETIVWRFRLEGVRTSTSRPSVSLFCISSVCHRWRVQAPAQEIADGVFEARLTGLEPGPYYVYVDGPAWGVVLGDLPPRHLLVRRSD